MNFELAQSDARFFYPAISEEELQNEALLLANYRRAMGRYRLMWVALGVGVVWWFTSYVRALPPAPPR